MTHAKSAFVVSVALLLVMACSNTPVAQEVIVVTATPTNPVKTSPASNEVSESRSTVIPPPTRTPQPMATPRIWPFSESEGEWFIDTDKDPITHKERIGAIIQPKDSTHLTDSALIVRCGYDVSDEAEAFVVFDDELVGTITVEVQFRFDETAIATEKWPISTSKTALFARSPTEFIWQLMNSEKLAIREEGGQTLVFDITGLANALFPHRDKCDWIGNGVQIAKPTPTARPTATPRPTNTPASAGVGGAPLPEEWDGSEGIAATESSADMMAVGVDGLSGTLHLIQIERDTKFTVILHNAGPGPYAAVIRRGGCPDRGEKPSGQFDYLLFNVVDGESISMVNTPAQFFQFSLGYIAVVDGTDLESDPLISCGNIPSPLR